jgi:tetratricopeptide (TPR) repeat protein
MVIDPPGPPGDPHPTNESHGALAVLALNALGVVEARTGNRSAAIEHWSRAVAIDPSQFDALFNLGLVAANTGRADVAKKALREYLERAPATRYAAERAQAADVLRRLR